MFKQSVSVGLQAVFVCVGLATAACSARGGDPEQVSSIQERLTVAVPFRVRAIDFTTFNDSDTLHEGNCGSGPVDQQADAAGGCLVGWAAAGEWLEYDVNAPQAGVFDFTVRLASAVAGRTLQLNVDGTAIGTLSAPSTGWTGFEDRKLQNVNLSAGPHVVRALSSKAIST
jgi:hypothetical protein